ncbi:MAG: glycosyltransferase family 2 protein [Sphingobacteriaceae bacterium]
MYSYSIISPVKNELNVIQKTIDSVLNQSIKPVEWVIVDDSSTDGTEKILKELSKKFTWIKVVKCDENKLKDYSSRVVFLFEYGYRYLTKEVEFISKLDGDVSFSPDFFNNILNAFEKNPKLGIASGHLTVNKIPEQIIKTPFICTRGATKVYRIKCLNDIGGIIPFQGWDTLDNVAARSKCWDVAILPEYFEHLKEEGSKVGNTYFSSFRTGFYNGSIPYLWLYFLIKIIFKLLSKPIIIGSILQFAGYIKGRYIIRNRPYPEFIVKQLHFEQRKTLKTIFSK